MAKKATITAGGLTAKKKPVSATRIDKDHDYDGLLTGAANSFASINPQTTKLFRTDVEGLNEIYLDNLPVKYRQHHNCSCCRRFIENYGGLVAVDPEGQLLPAMWEPGLVPEFYQPAFAAMQREVKKAKIESVFICKETTWGNPVTGEWTHLSIVPPTQHVYRARDLTPGQKMAANKEDYKTIINALREFSIPLLDQALRVLKSETLVNSEKYISPIQWLRNLHDRPKGRIGENILWREISSVPNGYLHPRASMMATLIADIESGMDFEQIRYRFEKKMNPTVYQRPQAPPSAGNIKAAEELFAKMGLAPALERRFLRLDEVKYLWQPPEITETKKETKGGVFGHLKPKNGVPEVDDVNLPTQEITWAKFVSKVLPEAKKVQCFVPSRGNFIALTTAVNADAPPILKWDSEEERNPVAWYVYPNGSPASQWGLRPASWTTVVGVCRFPNNWGSKPMPYLTDGAMLLLEGMAETRFDAGNALFPGTLKSEVHSVHSTIEAYSKNARFSGEGPGTACGIDVRKESDSVRVRAFINGGWSSYLIDRMD